jgi:uncharacterized protein YndB with AHSA1/START domain
VDAFEATYAQSMDQNRVASVSRVIHAPAKDIFNLLADPRKHSEFDGSGSVVRVRKGPPRLFLGARFSMDMKLGPRYFVSNKVVVFEENKSIAWHHFAQFIWRYDLEEVPGGTNVTESFNFDKPWGFTISLSHKDRSNVRAMQATLERIENIVTA